MKYFAVLLPMKSEEKSKEYRTLHLDYIQEMSKNGNILQFGKLANGAGGLIIYQGSDIEAVTALAKTDPYIQLGARDFEIHEWDMKTDYTITK